MPLEVFIERLNDSINVVGLEKSLCSFDTVASLSVLIILFLAHLNIGSTGYKSRLTSRPSPHPR